MLPEILINAALATMEHGVRPYGLIPTGAVAMDGGRIVWCGTTDAMPDDYAAWPRRDLDGRLVTPALIDCHTHIVYGGDRAREFEMRLEGMSYEDVARAGGGIFSTVEATRKAGPDTLLAGALPRVDALNRRGRLDHRDQVGLRPRCRDRAHHAAHGASNRRRASGARAHELPRRPRGPPGVRRPLRRLSRRGMPAGPGGCSCATPRRCGGRLLRGYRLHPRPDRARVRARPRAGAAGEASRGAALGSRRSRPCREAWRAVCRSPGIRRRGRGALARRIRNRRGAPAGSLLYPACDATPAGGALSQTWGADGDCDGLQTRAPRRSRRSCWR